MPTSVSCPFCGKQRVIIDTLNYTDGKPAKFRAQCRECSAATGWRDTEDEAWAAWNWQRSGEVNFLINRNACIRNSLLYYRNPETGRCTAQKECRGKMLRIKEEVFRAAYGECEKRAGEVMA